MFRTFGRTCNQLLSPGPVKMMSLRLQFHCLRFQKPFGMVRIVLDTAETKWTPSEKQALFQFSFFGGGSRFCDHWMIAAAFLRFVMSQLSEGIHKVVEKRWFPF